MRYPCDRRLGCRLLSPEPRGPQDPWSLQHRGDKLELPHRPGSQHWAEKQASGRGGDPRERPAMQCGQWVLVGHAWALGVTVPREARGRALKPTCPPSKTRCVEGVWARRPNFVTQLRPTTDQTADLGGPVPRSRLDLFSEARLVTRNEINQRQLNLRVPESHAASGARASSRRGPALARRSA